MYKKILFSGFMIFGLVLSGEALAATKFSNKDTAKERKDFR